MMLLIWWIIKIKLNWMRRQFFGKEGMSIDLEELQKDMQ